MRKLSKHLESFVNKRHCWCSVQKEQKQCSKKSVMNLMLDTDLVLLAQSTSSVICSQFTLLCLAISTCPTRAKVQQKSPTSR